MVHAQLEHGGAMTCAQAQQGQRHADVVVQVAGCSQAPRVALPFGEHRGDHFLGGRLAVAAGHRHHGQHEPGTPGGADARQRHARIAHDKLRQSGIGNLVRDERRASAARSCLIQVVVRVEILAHQRDEEFAFSDAARIGGHAGRLLQQQRHARPFPIVERQLLATDVLIGFVTLAGKQHHVFRRRRPDGLQDGARAIDLHVGTRRFGHAGQDLLDDRLGRFGARVVAGHHHVVGQLRGNGAHHRTLARIALTAAAEQADQAAGTCRGHGTQRQQRTGQRVRRVGVVHHHQRTACRMGWQVHCRFHGLQTAIDGIRRRQFTRNLRKRQAQLVQHARDQQQVRNVVRTQEARHDLGFAMRRHQRKDLALRRCLQVARTHRGRNLRIVAQAVTHRRHAIRQAGQHPAPCLIVGVDHRGGQAGPTEKARLGFFVAFHRDVVVQMVAGQIREGGERHAHAIHAALLDADRRRLHGHGLRASVAHRGQRAVHSQHIRRRQAATQRLAVGQHGAQRADGAASLVVAAQRVGNPLHRRRLAISAGHRNHGQRRRRTAIPGVAQFAQQRAQAGHRKHGRAGRRGLYGIGGRRFEQHGAGAQRQRLIYIETAVARQSRASNEHVARLDVARVQLEMRGQRHALMQPRHGLGNRGGRGRVEAVGAHLPGSLIPATIVDSNGASGRTPISLRLPPTIWENTGAAMAPP